MQSRSRLGPFSSQEVSNLLTFWINSFSCPFPHLHLSRVSRAAWRTAARAACNGARFTWSSARWSFLSQCLYEAYRSCTKPGIYFFRSVTKASTTCCTSMRERRLTRQLLLPRDIWPIFLLKSSSSASSCLIILLKILGDLKYFIVFVFQAVSKFASAVIGIDQNRSGSLASMYSLLSSCRFFTLNTFVLFFYLRKT